MEGEARQGREEEANVKAKLKGFTGSYIREQRIGGPDEMCDADVTCVFTVEGGREVVAKARIKQTVGTSYGEKVIEVYPVEGLPANVEYDHEPFAAEARRFYTERIVKQGP